MALESNYFPAHRKLTVQNHSWRADSVCSLAMGKRCSEMELVQNACMAFFIPTHI